MLRVKKILLISLAFIFLLSPFSISVLDSFSGNNINYIYAQDEGSGSGSVGDEGSGSGSSSANPIKLNNPLGNGNIEDIPTFVEKLLEIVMKVGVPLIAIAIIYTGYLFIAAQGNPEKLKKAKDAIIYVFIGSIILLGAYVIAQTLQGTINAIRGN